MRNGWKTCLGIALLSLIGLQASAQCTPDTTINSNFSPTPQEGIAEGTIGNPYEAVIHLRIPAETTITVTVSIDSVILYDLTGLPEGISYECNPDSCVFPGDSYGCIRLFGTPSNPLDTGVNDLVARFELHSNFPTFTYDEEGYELVLNPGQNLGLPEPVEQRIKSIRPSQVPMSSNGDILVEATQATSADLVLYSILGAEVARESLQIESGMNRIPVAPMNLKPGPYFARLNTAAGALTLRLVIQ